MPEKGWTALTVREHVGIRIKELAKKQGLTVSDYLEQIIAVLSEIKPNIDEKWITCDLCGVKLKARNMSEHMAKVHPKVLDSQNNRTSRKC
jgi:uncharacterized protein with PIN domain